LRLSRPQDAHDAVMAAFVTYEGLDERCTAEMLLGSAEVRLNDINAGLARLDRAAQIAMQYDAHIAVRSEIALQRGLAFYSRRDLDAAEGALVEVDPGTDIIFATAFVYRGWIETARPNYSEAKRLFFEALAHLDRCRHQDRTLEANVLQALSHLVVETLDFEGWAFVAKRSDQMVWTDAMRTQRFWVLMNGALALEAQGKIREAHRVAAEADRLAPSDALRVHSICRRAAMARLTGEGFVAEAFVHDAHQRFIALDAGALRGDELSVPLVLAEELALAENAPAAQTVLALHARRRPTERVLAMSDDPRQVAYEELVVATVAHAAFRAGQREGNPFDRAHALYASAMARFRQIGYVARAAQAAIGFAELAGLSYPYEFAEITTRAMSEQSGFRRSLGTHARLLFDEVAQTLTPTERDVLSLVLKRHTNREISEARGVALQTIKNTVSSILAKYGVNTREQLFGKLRRAVGPARYESGQRKTAR
jgi:DNA-binding CsgD family transcriptional regulator/tetratricopeptide (TPR) repeat protein